MTDPKKPYGEMTDLIQEFTGDRYHAARYKLYKLKDIHPFPWVISDNNDHNIVVRDCIGNMVFVDTFPEISSDDPAGVKYAHDQHIRSSRLLAEFLVELSNSEQ